LGGYGDAGPRCTAMRVLTIPLAALYSTTAAPLGTIALCVHVCVCVCAETTHSARLARRVKGTGQATAESLKLRPGYDHAACFFTATEPVLLYL
jgi:hypothetical protein